MDFSVFQFVPITSFPVTGYITEKSGFISFTALWGTKIDMIPPEPSPGCSAPTLSKSYLSHCLRDIPVPSDTVWDSLQHVFVCLKLGRPELDPALQMCLTSADWKGRITSVSLLVMLFLMQSRTLLATQQSRKCGLMFKFVVTRTQAFFCKAFM